MGPSGVGGHTSGQRRAFVMAAGAIVVVAAMLRLVALDHPPRMYFDEVYYAEDAEAVASRGVEERRPSHPPLGPALMSVGVITAGENPWGWRVVPALAGTGVVLFTGLAARRLGANRMGALAAMLLVALDGLSLTMSRIAMLDGLVAALVLAGFWLLLGTLDRVPGTSGWLGRLAGAGAAFGFATAVKWSGALALGAGALVSLGHITGWWHRRRVPVGSIRRAAGGMLLAFVVVPAGAYIASYTGWFLNYEDTAVAEERCPAGNCSVGPVETAGIWWEEQLYLVDYHRRLPATHPYRSSPVSWPLLMRPALYYFEECPADERVPPGGCHVEPGREAKILGLGNPALWWTALPLTLVVGWSAVVRRRRWALVLSAFLLALYVPWFFAGKDGYLFYMTPVVPFLALAVAAPAQMRSGWWRGGVLLISGLALAAFVYFAPIWYGIPLPSAAADARMWLDSWR